MEEIVKLLNRLLDIAFNFAPRLLMAIIVLIAGIWMVNIFSKIIIKAMKRSDIDLSIQSFLSSFLSILLKILIFISVAGMLGIEMTSFIAILGAAGLAVGLALQGSLANLAGGFLILLFKPFKVGDYIEAQNHSGSVRGIQIFSTVLVTPDNKTIIIPNGNLSNNSIVNYSRQENRRVDFTFGTGYNDDILKTKNILQQIIENEVKILNDPAPFIGLAELAESSVNFTVRVWCKSSDYMDVFFTIQEKVKLAFDQNGISIPYPQHDIHLYKHEKNI